MNAVPSSQDIDEAVNELRSSGISFSVKYIGSIRLENSIYLVPDREQSAFGRICIAKLLKASGEEIDIVDDTNYASFFSNETPNVVGLEVDFNVTVKAVLVMPAVIRDDLSPILVRIDIREIRTCVSGSGPFAEYICLFAKIKTPLKNDQVCRHCFVFHAENEVIEINKILSLAFQVQQKDLGTLPVSQSRSRCASRDSTPTPSSTTATPSKQFDELNGRVGMLLLSDDRFVVHNLSPSTNSPSPSVQNEPPPIPPRPSKVVPLPRTRSPSIRQLPERTSQTQSQRFPSRHFTEITANLAHEPWFHGVLNRAEAEARITQEGQFLVRHTPKMEGQVILSGMQQSIVRHILLVETEGRLWSMGREFGTVSELIKYHYQTRAPLISKETTLILMEPVHRLSY